MRAGYSFNSPYFLTLYKTLTSQPFPFNLDDEGSVFVQNVGIDLRNHTVITQDKTNIILTAVRT
jgi:hypothetical protein